LTYQCHLETKGDTALKQGNEPSHEASRVTWENLERTVRGHLQGYLQFLLEEEVTDVLGRAKYQRKAAVDGREGYRNGYGKKRNLTLSCGTITLNRPRVRGLDERFESRLLPVFVRRTK